MTSERRNIGKCNKLALQQALELVPMSSSNTATDESIGGYMFTTTSGDTLFIIFVIASFVYISLRLYLLSKDASSLEKEVQDMKHNQKECKQHKSYIKGIPHGKTSNK